MVKEVPQTPKYQCEHCDRIYAEFENAQKCESKGLPEFKYNIGDEVETMIQLIRLPETLVNGKIRRLFDVGGEFAKVKITVRYHWNHKPFYTFEHPQIQGQFWRYPEAALDLPDKFNELKESPTDYVFDLKVKGYPAMQLSERGLRFQAIWRKFMVYLRSQRIARTYNPKIVAEPINSS